MGPKFSSRHGKQSWGEFIRRSFFGLFFLGAGIGHALDFDVTKDGAGILSNPELAPYLATAAIFCLLVGGLSLILGWYTRLGALLIALFLIPATQLHAVVMQVALNNATALTVEASEKAKQSLQSLAGIAVQGHQGNYAKNIVLLVIALSFVVSGAGSISLDRRRQRAR